MRGRVVLGNEWCCGAVMSLNWGFDGVCVTVPVCRLDGGEVKRTVYLMGLHMYGCGVVDLGEVATSCG